jgi:sugar phosphate isomerase/epimerase
VKLAVRESMVPGATLEERIAFVDQIGYDGIEVHLADSLRRSPDELESAFRRQRVRPTTIDGVRKVLDPDPAERAASLTLLRERLELCARLGGVTVLLVPIFGRPLLPDLAPIYRPDDLERALFLAQLKDIAEHATEAGAKLAIEPLNRYETHFINTLDQGAELCRRINRPSVRIMADFFHMSIEEASIDASIRQSAPFIEYVHVADSNRKQPGRGHLNFGPGFRALKAAGYDGYLGVECGLLGPTADALREAAVFLRKTWNEA